MSSMWSPACNTGLGGEKEDLRCGTQRASMKKNVLIAKTELGKIKKTTFNHSPPDKVYGMHLSSDAEGARAVTSSWHEHVPNPHALPGPDYLAMNKAAADSGLVSSNQVRDFRASHPATLRTGIDKVAKPAPQLPSDHDTSFTYGKPSTYRSAEEVRNFGPSEPQVKALVQGQYVNEWADMNLARKEEFDVRHKYIKPSATAATRGHALGARLAISKTTGSGGSSSSGSLQHPAAGASLPGAAGSWKMKKFEKTAPRVTQHMLGWDSAAAAAADHTCAAHPDGQ